jgi:hypothetical protein
MWCLSVCVCFFTGVFIVVPGSEDRAELSAKGNKIYFPCHGASDCVNIMLYYIPYSNFIAIPSRFLCLISVFDSLQEFTFKVSHSHFRFRSLFDSKTAIEAAKLAGVRFALIVSVCSIDHPESIFGKQFIVIEDSIKKSGLPHTIIRLPLFYVRD